MLNLVPTPKNLEMIDETYHKISASVYSHNPDWEKYIPGFKDMLFKAYEIESDDNTGGIELFVIRI